MATQSSPQPVATPAGPALQQQPLPGSPVSASVGLLGVSGSAAGPAPGGRGEVKPAESTQRGAETELRNGTGTGSNESASLVTGHNQEHAGGADREAAYREAGLRLSPACARLPVSLAVTVPVREFRVRMLLAMAPGEIIETQWGHGEDLPLASGDVQVAWSEFEVVDTRLAVRVTRLA